MLDLMNMLPKLEESETQTRYFLVYEEFYKKFGEGIPRAEYPRRINDEQVIRAMESCLASGKNEMEKLLGISMNLDSIH